MEDKLYFNIEVEKIDNEHQSVHINTSKEITFKEGVLLAFAAVDGAVELLQDGFGNINEPATKGHIHSVINGFVEESIKRRTKERTDYSYDSLEDDKNVQS